MTTPFTAKLQRRGDACVDPEQHKIGDAVVFEDIPDGGVRWFFPDGCAFDIHVRGVKQ